MGDGVYGGRQQNVVFELPTITHRRKFTSAVKLEKEKMETRMSGNDKRNIRKVGAEVFWARELSSAPTSWSTPNFGFNRTVGYVCEHVVCLPGS